MRRMYKSYYVKGSTAKKFLYKTYANKLTKIKNLVKKNYYYHQLSMFRKQPKKIWEILRFLLPCKQNPSFTNSLTVNDAEIVDPKEISRPKQFNTFFVNIAKNLAEKLKYTDDAIFISNLRQSSPSSIRQNPTKVCEIVNLINSLQINKASGFNDILPYFLKIGADVLAYPLSYLTIAYHLSFFLSN